MFYGKMWFLINLFVIRVSAVAVSWTSCSVEGLKRCEKGCVWWNCPLLVRRTVVREERLNLQTAQSFNKHRLLWEKKRWFYKQIRLSANAKVCGKIFFLWGCVNEWRPCYDKFFLYVKTLVSLQCSECDNHTAKGKCVFL